MEASAGRADTVLVTERGYGDFLFTARAPAFLQPSLVYRFVLPCGTRGVSSKRCAKFELRHLVAQCVINSLRRMSPPARPSMLIQATATT